MIDKKIKIIMFMHGDWHIPFIDGVRVGNGDGTPTYLAEMLQVIAQKTLGATVAGYDPGKPDEVYIPISLTQMVAMIDKRPEALEEALKVLESYE